MGPPHVPALKRVATVKLRFVTAPHGNYHMTELLGALCATACDAGHDASLETSFAPPETDAAYVVIPHEYYSCEPESAWPSHVQRGRTIALCVENPPTSWFETVCRLAPHFPRVLAINRSSQAELHRRGIDADHLQLGYTTHWDSWNGVDSPRPVDVTYLGTEDERRDAIVAGYGRWLWHRRTAMFVPRLAPKPSASPDYLIDGLKYEHLRKTKVLVNLHREQSSSFEWVRILQAIANGCVVVSEPAGDCHPLLPGEHFVVASAGSIPHVVEGLLREPERMAALRDRAYEMTRHELHMSAAAERLMAAAEQLIGARPRAQRTDVEPSVTDPERAERRLAAQSDDGRLAAAVRTLAADTLELKRSVQFVLERIDGRDPTAGPEVFAATPAYRDARPRVTVAITLLNYEREVVEALASVDASEFEDYEVLVLDDASTDGSLDAVRDFFLDRPWMPATLLRHRVNRGLGASRNALARHARGELMFVLDADNTVQPSALGRLVEALDADPGASFAYPLIAVTRSGRPVGLLSRYAWDPNGFRDGNYIDAMAMIRLDDYLALGGCSEDIRLTGFEDFHFWCACVASGRRGTLVPEVLASYRQTDHSLLSSHADRTAAWSVLHSRFPAIVPSRPGEPCS